MHFEARTQFAAKLYYYTARKQTSEATKKCADSASPAKYKDISRLIRIRAAFSQGAGISSHLSFVFCVFSVIPRIKREGRLPRRRGYSLSHRGDGFPFSRE